MSSTLSLQDINARLRNLAGGVNMRDSIIQLQNDEARALENMLLDQRGSASKRSGCTSQGTFGVSADRIISSYVFYRAGSAPQVLIHTTAGKLYYTNDPAANPITWTSITTGLSGSGPMSFETFNQKCYMSNGVDNYASWDGTTYATFASAPKGKYLRLWKDAMWVSGVSGLPDRVYTSNAGDAETFGVAAWVDIAKGNGDATLALGSDGIYLIVWKNRTTHIIYDPVTFANRVVDFEKGCESHFSVVQFEGEIFFLSRRGICQYLGDSPSRFISGKIDPLFSPEILNLSTLQTAWAYTVENRVCWALPEAGNSVPTLQIDYYPRLASQGESGPFAFHRIPATTFVKVRSGTTEYLYGSKTTENKFLWIFSDVGTDDGATFQGLVETGAFDFGSPDRTKYLRRLRFLGRGKFTVMVKRNFESAIYRTYLVDMTASTDTWSLSDTWGSGTWGPNSLVKEQLVNTDIYARYVTLRFTDAETSMGLSPVLVGSKEYSLSKGEWGILGVLIDGELLGVRS